MVAVPLDDLSDDAAVAVLDLLGELRVNVVAAIVSARDPLQSTYRQLLREIDGMIAGFERNAIVAMNGHIERAATAGDESVLDDARAGGLEIFLSYMGVSPTLVRTAAEYSADLISGDLSPRARAEISRQIRLAALGGLSTTELITRIGKNLTDKSVFKTLADRAEAIARTEVSRVRAMAAFEQGSELVARYPGIRKRWEHASSSPGFTRHQRRMSRPNHVRLARETRETPIPWEEDFNLGSGIKEIGRAHV